LITRKTLLWSYNLSAEPSRLALFFGEGWIPVIRGYDSRGLGPNPLAKIKKPAEIETGGPYFCKALFDIPRALLAVTLSSESFFGAALFAWLQVKRVPFDFLNNVFLLNLSLEAA
jgi:hypothetical protein